MEISKIYVDLDGTLVDFEGSVKELGWTVEKAKKYENDDTMWDSPHFYPNLRPLHGAIDFFDTANMLPS